MVSSPAADCSPFIGSSYSSFTTDFLEVTGLKPNKISDGVNPCTRTHLVLTSIKTSLTCSPQSLDEPCEIKLSRKRPIIIWTYLSLKLTDCRCEIAAMNCM